MTTEQRERLDLSQRMVDLEKKYRKAVLALEFIAFNNSPCWSNNDRRKKAATVLCEIGEFEKASNASTQNQALAALNFFYLHVIGERLKNVDALRATRPQQVREAVSQPETLRLLNAVPDVAGYPTRLIVRLIYGCGLRVSEPLNIRIKDLLNSERQVVIHGAKGGKDRVVNLPCSVQDQIIQQKLHAKKVFERDKQCKIPIWLPHQLARKYPEYQFAWAEAWLFPQRHPCADPRTGQIVRYHLHAANVQRAVKVARRASGVFATPHVLRHCYATHCLENGARLKALQEAMGHKYAETTMGYVHEEALSVRSPLEVLR